MDPGLPDSVSPPTLCFVFLLQILVSMYGGGIRKTEEQTVEHEMPLSTQAADAMPSSISKYLLVRVDQKSSMTK